MPRTKTVSTTYLAVRDDFTDFTNPPEAPDNVVEVDVAALYVDGGSTWSGGEGQWLEDINATVNGKPFYLTDAELEDVAEALLAAGDE